MELIPFSACNKEDGKFLCANGKQCLDITKRCDKNNDCDDNSDEDTTQPRFYFGKNEERNDFRSCRKTFYLFLIN